MHRWAQLLKQQMLITVYCLPTKEYNFRFHIYMYLLKWQPIYTCIYSNLYIYVYIYVYISKYIYLYLYLYNAV
jgi:hypothetical protein